MKKYIFILISIIIDGLIPNITLFGFNNLTYFTPLCTLVSLVIIYDNRYGTGDIYASAFVGALMNGKSVYDSARIAADFCVECIKETQKHENHWYGSAFEPVLYKLIEMLK